jgi:hypothetical protein
MTPPDLNEIAKKSAAIVESIGRESVEVFVFLCKEFSRGPVTQNHLFQFVFRSFYRLDNAGLTPDFKSAYFEILEASRSGAPLNLAAIVRGLYEIPNRKGQRSLQFSFATKLANTVDPRSPIYDAEVARLFGFRPPHDGLFESRLGRYLDFHTFLRRFYEDILDRELLRDTVALFHRYYSPEAESVPPVKALDFVFWAAGKQQGEQ